MVNEWNSLGNHVVAVNAIDTCSDKIKSWLDGVRLTGAALHRPIVNPRGTGGLGGFCGGLSSRTTLPHLLSPIVGLESRC